MKKFFLPLFISFIYVIFEITFRYRLIEISSKFPTLEEIENLENIGRFLSSLGFMLFINNLIQKNKKVFLPLSFSLFYLFQYSIALSIEKYSSTELKYDSFVIESTKERIYSKNKNLSETYFGKTYISLLPYLLYDNEKVITVAKKDIDTIIKENLMYSFDENSLYYTNKIYNPVLQTITELYKNLNYLKSSTNKIINNDINSKYINAYEMLKKNQKSLFFEYRKYMYKILGISDLYNPNNDTLASSHLNEVWRRFKNIDNAQNENEFFAIMSKFPVISLASSGQIYDLCPKLSNEKYRDCHISDNKDKFIKIIQHDFKLYLSRFLSLDNEALTYNEYLNSKYSAIQLNKELSSNYNYSYLKDNGFFSKNDIRNSMIKHVYKSAVEKVYSDFNVKKVKNNNKVLAAEFINSPSDDIIKFTNSKFIKLFIGDELSDYFYNEKGEFIQWEDSDKDFKNAFVKKTFNDIKKKIEARDHDFLKGYAKTLFIIPFAIMISTLMIFLNILSLINYFNITKDKRISIAIKSVIFISFFVLLAFYKNEYDENNYYEKIKSNNIPSYKMSVLRVMQNASLILQKIDDIGLTKPANTCIDVTLRIKKSDEWEKMFND